MRRALVAASCGALTIACGSLRGAEETGVVADALSKEQAPAPTATQAAELPAAPREGLSLRRAIELTLQNNRALGKASLDRENERFDLRVAEREFTPLAAVTSGAGYNPVRNESDRSTTRDAFVTASVSQRVPTGGRVAIIWDNSSVETRPTSAGPTYDSSVFLQLEQPLLRGAGLRANLVNLRIARIAESSNVIEFRRTVMNTVTSVIFSYRSLLGATLQLEVAEAAVQRARDQLRVNQALVSAGVLPPVEIIQTEADIASQEFNLLTARSSLEAARFNLVRLLDIEREASLDPTDAIELPQFDLPFERARQLAYQHRPDYRQSTHAVAIAEHSLDAAKSNELWDLTLAARYRVAGDDPEFDEAWHDAFSRVNEDWSVRLSLSVPIGDLSRRQRFLRARNQLLKANIDLVEATENIEIELRDIYRSIEISQQRVRVAGIARDLAARTLEIEKGKLQTGRTSNFAVVSFQNDLVQARLNEIGAQISYLNALTSLDQTLGRTLEAWGIRIEEIDGRDRPAIEPAPDTTPAP